MKKFRIISIILVLAITVVLATSCASSPRGDYTPVPDPSPIMDNSNRIIQEGNEYLEITENPFVKANEEPNSMFALSVSTAAYSNLRNYVNKNQAINPNQINIEQIVNYFRYDYPDPQQGEPLSVTPSFFPCPWNEAAYLLTVGLKAEEVDTSELSNNLVFLLDVSGSMNRPDKLGLMQQAFLLLLENLNENDTVSIVTYAGSDKVLLNGGRGNEKTRISGIIENLSAGGSTAGAQGISTAYEIAQEHFITGGNNRVILVTDGDFNVGISSMDELKSFITQKRATGVYLTTLGVGTGNMKNTTMETLANNGNGSYSYLDSIQEARKVLVEEIGSTLNIIAKDAKASVEFNPDYVDSYRLLGYENLLMSQDEWENPETDAGEIGTGFTVTAVYEVVFNPQADLDAEGANYLDATVRYKSTDLSDTTQYEIKVGCGKTNITDTPTRDMAFISALVETSLLLRASNYKGTASISSVNERLAALDLTDNNYMEEFRALAIKIAQQYFKD